MTDTTFSVRLPKEVHKLLESLSKATRRSKNYLAREAITNYVQSEAEIVDGIKQGLEDIRAGRTVAHEEVVRKSRAIVAKAYRRERRKA